MHKLNVMTDNTDPTYVCDKYITFTSSDKNIKGVQFFAYKENDMFFCSDGGDQEVTCFSEDEIIPTLRKWVEAQQRHLLKLLSVLDEGIQTEETVGTSEPDYDNI